MRQGIVMLLIFLSFITACAKPVTLDDARQIAVNRVMTDDNYVQNDGDDLKELKAGTLDCDGCYSFQYKYRMSPEYIPGVDGYIVDVVMKNDKVTSVFFSEVKAGQINNSLPSIADRFDEFCDNKCGDGYCNDIVCQDAGCVCEENSTNCPEDCR